MGTDFAPPVTAPRFKILHIMIALAVFAMIFAILRSRDRE